MDSHQQFPALNLQHSRIISFPLVPGMMPTPRWPGTRSKFTEATPQLSWGKPREISRGKNKRKIVKFSEPDRYIDT